MNSGVFQPRETGYNGHVSIYVHGNYNIERLASRTKHVCVRIKKGKENTFVRTRRNIHTLARFCKLISAG